MTDISRFVEKGVLPRIRLPDIRKQPNLIYKNWLEKGLQPNKFKTKEALFKAVKALMNTQKINGKQISLGQAIKEIFGDNYTGIPLAYNKTGSSRTGDRKITEVFFDARKFNARIPIEAKEWALEGERTGRLQKGGFERYEARIRVQNTKANYLRKRIQKLTGIKFDLGHLISLASMGSDDPYAKVNELRSENRSHGEANLISKENLARLGIPFDWLASITDHYLQEKGLKTGAGLPFGAISDKDKALATRHGVDVNKISAQKFQELEIRLLERALRDFEKANKDGNADQWKRNILSRVNAKGEYVQPNASLDRTAPTVPATQRQEIVQINPSRVKSLIPGISPNLFSITQPKIDAVSKLAEIGLKETTGVYGAAVKFAEGSADLVDSVVKGDKLRTVKTLTGMTLDLAPRTTIEPLHSEAEAIIREQLKEGGNFKRVRALLGPYGTP